MRNRIRLILLGFAAALFASSFLTVSTAQRRPAPFSHNTSAHREGKFKDNCGACHELPSKNWASPRRDKQEPFPDVTSFPYKKHVCNTCHSSGAKPDLYSNGGAFCGNCHVAASMLATGRRGVLPFPVK